jgi:pimeloyl-ACP methyl ester carboxylesterase
MTYKTTHLPEQARIRIRSLDYNLYCWGDKTAPPVILLHGFADTAMSFHFMAELMTEKWYLIAPDLQGFGETGWNTRGYWFPDYLADLDGLLDEYFPHVPVRLVGHSMGGNIATHYAGIFPDKVSHLVSLDSFGLQDTRPEQAPDRFAEWLQQWKNGASFSEYDDIASYVEIIKNLAPFIDIDQARFLAPYWCRQTEQGKWTSRVDPRHKMINPVLYRRAEAQACWRRIKADSMLVLGADSCSWSRYYEDGMRADFKPFFNTLRETVIKDAGHMLHLDQPVQLAVMLDEFLSA